MASIENTTTAIRDEALRIGFSACGFSPAEPLSQDAERLQKWLDSGYHASMKYMENHFEKRTDPTKLVEGCRSVISLLTNYKTSKEPTSSQIPVISKYAYGTDYHFVIKNKMRSLFEFIDKNFGPVKGRVFVDSAPVLDRAWARRAGLGWIGKNSNLIHRKLGSFVFISEILIDLELEYNRIPENDFCGACSICIDSCPTEAILPGKVIDSNKCISYQTIENRGEIPGSLKGRFENRLFGCDICQDVCPWNQKTKSHQNPDFTPPKYLLEMTDEEWKQIDESSFNFRFKNSPLKRTGYHNLMRNLDFLQD